jgi:polysaccharide biosynthesis/export protein
MRKLLMLMLCFTAPLAASQGTPSPGATVTAEAAPGPVRDYVLNTGDVLKIAVTDEPQLSGNQYRIDTDGAFQYPYLGRVLARGKTTRQLQEDVTKGLADGWVRRPQVTVEIEQYRARNIQVVGEVRSPAQYSIQGTTTLLEALAKAGFLLPTAGTEALIMRRGASEADLSAAKAGGVDPSRQIHVNLTALLSGQLDANVELQDGDVVMVLKAEKFYVSGQVKSPGAFTWEPGMTVRTAIIMAGGMAEKGSSRRIRIIRTVEEKGKKVERRINVDQNEPVLAGDTVDVQQRLL